MAVTPKVLIAPKQAEAVQTTQYTATGARAIIDKFTVTNTTLVNVSISVNLVSAGDTAGAANRITDTRVVAPDETYTCPELVGHVLDPGGFISTLASAATSLTIRCSGREIA